MAMKNSDGSPTNAAPPQGLFRQRHFVFVACMGLVTAAVWIGVPVAVWRAIIHCKGVACLSLEADLRRSQDPMVQPCDDFYGHVCGRWPEVERVYRTPTVKYDAANDLAFLRDVMFSPTQRPNRHGGVQDLMVELLVTCHTQQPDEKELQSFLNKLRLPWPAPSVTSELEVLDIIAGSSLAYNLPLMWIVAVGRHLRRPRQNALYVTLDPAVKIWMRHVADLVKRRTVALFLRRCAERVGGTGQSYDGMIRNVLTTHREVQRSLSYRYSIIERPEFINFSDVTLRQAVNRHLPDESQQWPEDSMICLQRVMFRRFRRRHLFEAQTAAAFKNYAGAYLVWYLAPYVSPYLTASLMTDMGYPQRWRDFVRARCSDLVRGVIPLAFWKTKTEEMPPNERRAVFSTYAALRSLMLTTVARHDRVTSQRLADYADTLSVNFYNMSVSWNVLDRMYAGVPHVHSRNLFQMYQAVVKHSLRRLERSMRRPNNSYVHVPHLASVGLYRILATREIRIPVANLLWPKFHHRYPLAARMAGLGVHAARKLIELVEYAFFFDANLRPVHPSRSGFPPSIVQPMYELYQTIDAGITRNWNVTLPEEEMMTAVTDAVALQLAYAASKELELEQPRDVTLALQAEDADERANFFTTLAPHQLFYRLSCFYQCAKEPELRERFLCNYVVPRLPGFASALGCKAGDRMFVPPGNFQW